MKAPTSKGINATASKMNANQLNTSYGGLSATTATTTSNSYDHRTFIKILYGDNKMLIVNSLCTCLHMMNYVKEKLLLSRDDVIDFIDFDGFIKEMPNLNNKDYAINLLVPTSSYTILKIEFDPNTNGKQYVPLINETKLNANMIKTIANLNSGKAVVSKDKNKQAVNTRLKQQSQLQQQMLNQNMSTPTSNSSLQPSSSTTALTKTKKAK